MACFILLSSMWQRDPTGVREGLLDGCDKLRFFFKIPTSPMQLFLSLLLKNIMASFFHVWEETLWSLGSYGHILLGGGIRAFQISDAWPYTCTSRSAARPAAELAQSNLFLFFRFVVALLPYFLFEGGLHPESMLIRIEPSLFLLIRTDALYVYLGLWCLSFFFFFCFSDFLAALFFCVSLCASWWCVSVEHMHYKCFLFLLALFQAKRKHWHDAIPPPIIFVMRCPHFFLFRVPFVCIFFCFWHRISCGGCFTTPHRLQGTFPM